MRPNDEQPDLRTPFPVMGGKRKVASLVWSRIGDVRNWIEPFSFGAAVTLARPGGAGPIETINDLNAYVPNFWRAVRADPDAVAAHADWPVSEVDMHARHRWLVQSHDAQHALSRVREDPDYYDARMAGWWAWGACCWIGTGWCDDGVEWRQLPDMDGSRGVLGQMPTLEMCAGGGKGVNGAGTFAVRLDDGHRPQLADAFARGRGVNANDAADTCLRRRVWLTEWMYRLADRLRPVRVCCGHWARVCDSESTLTRLGTTGVFLDPPYRPHIDGKKNRTARIYANDGSQDVNALCDEVQAWCLKWGDNPDIRIALCGNEGEYPEIDAAGWTCEAWTSSGYGNRTAAGKANAARERIWFSPACLEAERPTHEQSELFAEVA